MKFLDLKYDAFGLDINDFSMKIVGLKKGRKGFNLVSLNETRIPEGIIEGGVIKKEESLAKIIKFSCATVKGDKLKTKYVVASLPEEKSFLQVIQMPEMSNEELALSVPFEAENYIPLPIEEVYLDFQVIKKYPTKLDVLIVAMPRKIVDSYVSCFKKAGLVPIVLEPESEAIARALVKNDTDASLTILIDFGENNTDFVVFSGDSVRFTSSIPISSRMLTGAISKTLKISATEAEKLKIEHGLYAKPGSKAEKASCAMLPVLKDLVTQIKKYMDFYHDRSFELINGGRVIEKILLCGGGSQLKGLPEFLYKNLDVLTELGNPLINLRSKKLKKKFKEIFKKDSVSFTTAIGLALRRVDNL